MEAFPPSHCPRVPPLRMIFHSAVIRSTLSLDLPGFIFFRSHPPVSLTYQQAPRRLLFSGSQSMLLIFIYISPSKAPIPPEQQDFFRRYYWFYGKFLVFFSFFFFFFLEIITTTSSRIFLT